MNPYFTGTSGYQYPAWKGTFYPEDLAVSKMLAFYAGKFPTTEVNYTFRHVPSAKTIDGWKNGTPAHFKFSLKAPQRITHFAKLKGCAEVLEVFCGAIAPLGEKLGPVLFQLPPNFAADAPRLGDFLDMLPPGVRAAFEFRHDSWFNDEVYELLRARNVALCIAESAELATPVVATADYGYLRLRREDYTAADIGKWAKIIDGQREGWSETFIYFKHEDSGVGPKFAARMIKNLGGQSAE